MDPVYTMSDLVDSSTLKRKEPDDQYELESDGEGLPPAKRRSGKKAGELNATDARALAKLHDLTASLSDEELLATIWIKGCVLAVFAEEHATLRPRLGTWSKDEIVLLKDAVTEHCAARGITENQFARIIHGFPTEETTGGRRSGEDKTIYQAIARKVVRRPISVVRDRLRRDYHPHSNAGPWTADADARLTELVTEQGQKWKQIAQTMERRPQDVRDRWVNVVGKTNRKVGTWTLEEDSLLRTAVAKIAEETDLKADVPDFPWPRVAEELSNTRTRLQCRERWVSALKGGDGLGGKTDASVKRKPAKPKAKPAPAKKRSDDVDPTLPTDSIPVMPPHSIPVLPYHATPLRPFNSADDMMLLCYVQSTNAQILAAVDWHLISRSIEAGQWTPDECCSQFLALDAQHFRRYEPSLRRGVLNQFLQPGECDPTTLDLQAVVAELRRALETPFAI